MGRHHTWSPETAEPKVVLTQVDLCGWISNSDPSAGIPGEGLRRATHFRARTGRTGRSILSKMARSSGGNRL